MLPNDLPAKDRMLSTNNLSHALNNDSQETSDATYANGTMAKGQQVTDVSSREGASKVKSVFSGSLSHLGKIVDGASTLRRRFSHQTTRTHVGDIFGPIKLQTFVLPYRKRAILTSSSEGSLESNQGICKLNACLNKPFGFEALQEFCEAKQSMDNIHFLLSINELSSWLAKGKIKEARDIFKQMEAVFLNESAPLEINLVAADRNTLLSCSHDLSSPEFEQALAKAGNYIKSLAGNNIDLDVVEEIRQRLLSK